ncbi:MAG: SAM-dependent methyltransferase [Oscillospiraceae bacterium]|nr:SAM-dependent methyltransferase [Oscillospiraceae bacterium]
MANELILQPRLRHLAELVPVGARLADVGTDHGYLPVWLLLHGRIRSAIASDINALPLRHAVSTAEACGVTDGIDFRHCAGLSGIAPQEVDTVVIAGMGGETIARILEDAPWTRTPELLLLLQPMTKVEFLRNWLCVKGYAFTGESLVEDKGFLYPVLQLRYGAPSALTPAQCYGGVMLEKAPLWGEYLTRQLRRLDVRLAGLRRGGASQELEETAALRQALAQRKESLACRP